MPVNQRAANAPEQKVFSINIRRMLENDAGQVSSLAKAADLCYWSEADYEKEANLENSLAFVAETNEEIAGFIVMRLITKQPSTSNSKNYGEVYSMNTVFGQSKQKSGNSAEIPIELEFEIEAEIYNIAVKEKYRQRKIGNRLLKRAFKEINEIVGKGKNDKTFRTIAKISVWLEVRESNLNAVNFYRTNGFEIVSRRRDFYKNPSEDALVMKLERAASTNLS